MPSTRKKVFISYARRDGSPIVAELKRKLEKEGFEVAVDWDRLRGGQRIVHGLERQIEDAEFLILVLTKNALRSEWVEWEWQVALRFGVCVLPLLGQDETSLDVGHLPKWMRMRRWYDLQTEWRTLIRHLRAGCKSDRVPFLAPDLRKNVVRRKREFDQVKELLVGGKACSLVALVAAAGFGKTTLAAQICHDSDVQDAFYDGILWVTLGPTPDLPAALGQFYWALTGRQAGFQYTEHGSQMLAERLKRKKCLLVIDDVWSAAHLDHFRRGAEKCARLVTTRRADVAPSARSVPVSGMRAEEAVELLASGLPGGRSGSLREDVEHFASELNNWPILLGLAAGALHERQREFGATPEKALKAIRRRFQRLGVTAFDMSDAKSREQAVALSVGASLHQLEADERLKCLELGIFPTDCEISLDAAARLWRTRRGGHQDDVLETAGDFAERLHIQRLIDFQPRESGGNIRVHAMMAKYFALELGNREAAAHRRLIQSWGDLQALPDDGYSWRWLAYHLQRAGRGSRLDKLLSEPKWLDAKLRATDVNSLLSDFAFLDEDSAAGEELALIESALGLSAHVLATDAEQLRGQFHGRLLSFASPGIRDFLRKVRQMGGRCWLRPMTPSLNAAGGAELFTLAGHSDKILAVAVTGDGVNLVSSSGDLTVRLWDLRLGKEVYAKRENDWEALLSVAVTPDGGRLISAGSRIKVRDLSSGNLVADWAAGEAYVRSVVATSDQSVVAGCDDGVLRVFDLDSGRLGHSVLAHGGPIRALALTSSDRLVSASEDGRLRVWGLPDFEPRGELDGHEAGVNAVTAVPGGGIVVSGSDDRTVRIWDASNCREVAALTGHAREVTAVAAPSPELIVSASTDRTLRLWSLKERRELRTLPGHWGVIRAIAAVPNGDVVTGADDTTLKVWKPERGRASPGPWRLGHSDAVAAVAVAPDDRWAVSASMAAEIKVWNLDHCQEAQSFAEVGRGVCALATVDHEKFVAALYEGDLRVWDVRIGKPLRTLRGHTQPVRSIAVIPGSGLVVSCSDDQTIRHWNLTSGRERKGSRKTVATDRIVALSADGRCCVFKADDDTLRVSRPQEPNGRSTVLERKTRVSALALDEDCRVAVSASEQGEITVWDLDSGAASKRSIGHEGEVRCLTISRKDGELYLASGSDDQSLKLWTLKDLELLGAFVADAPVLSAAFNSACRRIVAGSKDGRVHFLQVEAGK